MSETGVHIRTESATHMRVGSVVIVKCACCSTPACLGTVTAVNDDLGSEYSSGPNVPQMCAYLEGRKEGREGKREGRGKGKGEEKGRERKRGEKEKGRTDGLP